MAYDKQEVHGADGKGKETTTYFSEVIDLGYALFGPSKPPVEHKDENRKRLAESTQSSTIGRVNALYSRKGVPLGSDALILIQQQERAMYENPGIFAARYKHELDMIGGEQKISDAFQNESVAATKKGEQKHSVCQKLGADSHGLVAAARAATSSIYNMFPMMADNIPGTGHPFNEIDEASSSSSSESAEPAKDEASSLSSSESVEPAKDEASSSSSSESVDPDDREDDTAEFNAFSVL